MEELKQAFEEYRKKHPLSGTPSNLYKPAEYIMNLGGKRFRPILSILAYQLFQDSWQKVLPVAYALEIFHNFSLVHDDIMDDAPLRRGQATVHTKWDLNTGILSGDVMLVLAYDFLTQFEEADKVGRLVQVFSRVAREVCEGQQMDIDFEQRPDVQIEEYIRMIELKTSVLLATCLEMGAIAAGASEIDIQHAYAVGRNIGIAFQLQDDLLDTFGDGDKIGKRVGGDIIQNKKTFLILKALELGNEIQNKELRHWMNTPTTDEKEKVEAVTKILLDLDIPQHAQAKKNEFRTKAFQHLDAISATNDKKLPIRMMMERLVSRDH